MNLVPERARLSRWLQSFLAVICIVIVAALARAAEVKRLPANASDDPCITSPTGTLPASLPGCAPSSTNQLPFTVGSAAPPPPSPPPPPPPPTPSCDVCGDGCCNGVAENTWCWADCCINIGNSCGGWVECCSGACEGTCVMCWSAGHVRETVVSCCNGNPVPPGGTC